MSSYRADQSGFIEHPRFGIPTARAIVAMRIAILGDHPDGWAVARAAAAGGRHRLIAYVGARLPADRPDVRATADLEDVLADPNVEAVIVASRPGERLDQLRRVLQSERPALCVHPVDQRPDGAYEMNMLQGDVHQVVLPLLPEAFHPQIDELRRQIPTKPRLIELTVTGPEDILFETAATDARPRFPGWMLLRRLGGEIVEVVGFAAAEEVRAGETALVQGRCEGGALFAARFLPQPAAAGHHTEMV